MKTDRTNAQRQARWRERRKQEVAALQASKGIPGPPALQTVPGVKRWSALLEQARAALQTVRDEMEGYIEDRSEEWQESDRAATMQEQVDALESVLADLEGIDM